MLNPTSIAVVGYGLVGRRHVDAIRQLPYVSLTAIVEPTDNSRDEAAAEGVPCLDSLDRLLDEVAVDGVILATPTPLHVEQGLACVERGIPLLVEKPIAVTSDHARQLVDAAAERQVPVLVGHHRRHNAVIRAAKSAIVDGAIGEIRAVQATCWVYKPDAYFDVSPWRKCKGAGPVSVNLVHDVDLLRHLCGEVTQVQAVATPARRGYENEDLSAAMLTFQTGAVATVSVSDSIAAPWSWELTANENPVYPATDQSCYLIGGSEGSLSLPDLRVWRHADHPDWWSPIGGQFLMSESNDPLVDQIAHFAAVIHGRESPLVSGLDGLRSLQVVEAVQLSAQSGQTIAITSQGGVQNSPALKAAR